MQQQGRAEHAPYGRRVGDPDHPLARAPRPLWASTPACPGSLFRLGTAAIAFSVVALPRMRSQRTGCLRCTSPSAAVPSVRKPTLRDSRLSGRPPASEPKSEGRRVASALNCESDPACEPVGWHRSVRSTPPVAGAEPLPPREMRTFLWCSAFYARRATHTRRLVKKTGWGISVSLAWHSRGRYLTRWIDDACSRCCIWLF